MTRDQIAALLDGATPGLRGEALPDHDEDGNETDFLAVFMVQEASGDGTTTACFCDLGDAKLYAAAPAIATAALAAMDREAALLTRVAELEAALAEAAIIAKRCVFQYADPTDAILALIGRPFPIAHAHMPAPDEGMVVAEDGAMMPGSMAAKVREHE